MASAGQRLDARRHVVAFPQGPSLGPGLVARALQAVMAERALLDDALRPHRDVRAQRLLHRLGPLRPIPVEVPHRVGAGGRAVAAADAARVDLGDEPLVVDLGRLHGADAWCTGGDRSACRAAARGAAPDASRAPPSSSGPDAARRSRGPSPRAPARPAGRCSRPGRRRRRPGRPCSGRDRSPFPSAPWPQPSSRRPPRSVPGRLRDAHRRAEIGQAGEELALPREQPERVRPDARWPSARRRAFRARPGSRRRRARRAVPRARGPRSRRGAMRPSPSPGPRCRARRRSPGGSPPRSPSAPRGRDRGSPGGTAARRPFLPRSASGSKRTSTRESVAARRDAARGTLGRRSRTSARNSKRPDRVFSTRFQSPWS